MSLYHFGREVTIIIGILETYLTRTNMYGLKLASTIQKYSLSKVQANARANCHSTGLRNVRGDGKLSCFEERFKVKCGNNLSLFLWRGVLHGGNDTT